MLKLSQLHGFNQNAILPTLSFNGSRTNTANVATYTFANFTLGTPDPRRAVIVAVHGIDSAADFSATGVNINAIAATRRVVTSSVNTYEGSLWSAIVPTGTSATISVAFSEAIADCHIGVWSAYNLNSLIPVTSQTDINGTLTLSVNIDAVAHSVVIGLVVTAGISKSPWSWTNLTERYDNAGQSQDSTGADTVVGSTGVTLAIQTVPTAGTTTNTMAVAVFR